jgi:hypothetical protein
MLSRKWAVSGQRESLVGPSDIRPSAWIYGGFVGEAPRPGQKARLMLMRHRDPHDDALAKRRPDAYRGPTVTLGDS